MTFQNPFVLGWKAAISNILIHHFHQNILNSCLQYHKGWEWEGELDDDTCQSRPGHLLRCQQPPLEFVYQTFIPVWSHQVRHGAVLDMGDDEEARLDIWLPEQIRPLPTLESGLSIFTLQDVMEEGTCTFWLENKF